MPLHGPCPIPKWHEQRQARRYLKRPGRVASRTPPRGASRAPRMRITPGPARAWWCPGPGRTLRAPVRDSRQIERGFRLACAPRHAAHEGNPGAFPRAGRVPPWPVAGPTATSGCHKCFCPRWALRTHYAVSSAPSSVFCLLNASSRSS